MVLRPLPTAVPNRLTLKGISGAPGHRFALINDRTLEKNEEGKVRVGKTNVVVRCLDISDHSLPGPRLAVAVTGAAFARLQAPRCLAARCDRATS